MTCENIIQILVAIILFLTFLAIVWYAFETRKLWKENVKQTELQLTPYLILDYKDDLICRNIGNGSAINVEISTFESLDKDSGNLVFRVTFPLLYVLEPKQEKIIKYDIKFENEELKALVKLWESTGKKWFPFFPEETKQREYPLFVDYENLENVPFRAEFIVKCREEKIKVVKIGKRAKKKGRHRVIPSLRVSDCLRY